MKDLLAAGVTIYAKNSGALSMTARGGHVEAVRLLLDQGADVCARVDYALRWAAENGHLGVVPTSMQKTITLCTLQRGVGVLSWCVYSGKRCRHPCRKRLRFALG